MKHISKYKDLLSVLAIVFTLVIFFYPFFFFGKLPIPADTITGLYHPYRDYYAKNYPNGMPYKNYLVTDPVRQQYVWKKLSIDMLKEKQIPIWNIYEMSGKPLLGNFQSGVFYPLNIILFINPFYYSWSVFIFLQMVLGGVFMFLYLRSLSLRYPAIILGVLSWVFSGFFISWLEWGNIVSTALWLPLMLVSVKPILEATTKKSEIFWFFVLLIAFCFSFFAGHLQTFFYISLLAFAYMVCLWLLSDRKIIKLVPFLTVLILFLTITSIQWVPTLQMVDLSGRATDQIASISGWFIPLQNLIQFISPDYFGNPSTLNYYGVFNYGEFIGYVGIGSLLFALSAVFYRRDRKVLFFSLIFLLSILFAIQNPISQLPFQLKIPFLSTAQPTRLLVLSCFTLSVLAALGFDYFLNKRRKLFLPISFIGVVIFGLWISLISFSFLYPSQKDAFVSLNNLKLPTILFIVYSFLIFAYTVLSKKIGNVLVICVLLFVIFDLTRFGWKYTPFVSSEYIFPKTVITQYLEKDSDIFRVSTTDDRILPPNFLTAYRIDSIEGYDPLFLKNYATFIASSQRVDHSIAEPFGFNRVIRPRNLSDNIVNFLNVKYIISFDEINNPNYEKILTEGMTKLYKNKNVLPRAFFVEKTIFADSIQKRANLVQSFDLSKLAVVSDKKLEKTYSTGIVEIMKYDPSEIEIHTKNKQEGFLILSDTYYPSFRATIDGHTAQIAQVNNAFKGLVIPAGAHVVIIKPALF